jgi:hypothetical protein
MKKVLTVVAVLGLIIALSGAARASVSAYTFNNIDQYYQNAMDQTVGWKFAVYTNLLVTDLGVWNQYGLAGSHEVGIWDATNSSLLVSATVTTSASGAHQDSGFLYVPVTTPATLLAGHSYVIGAHYVPGVDFWVSAGSAIMNLPISYDTSAGGLYTHGSLLTQPSTTWTSFGLMGPNFQAAPVPIPPAFWLLGGGLVGLIGLKRKYLG